MADHNETRVIYDENGNPRTNPNNTIINTDQDNRLDREWAKTAFLMSDSRIASLIDNKGNITTPTDDEARDILHKYWSSASRKFTDTQIGGNVAVNARPQFTPYADIRVKGRMAGRKDATPGNMSGNYGMGRYYSEAIDDNAQTIYMAFGTPQYNSLFSFFTNAFDPSVASMVNTGRKSNTARFTGEILGMAFTFVAFPVISAFVYGSRIMGKLLSKPTSKFYTFKPSMHTYWVAVDMLVNQIMVNRGLMPKFPGGDNGTQAIGDTFKYSNEFISLLHTKFGRMISSSGRIDILSVAVRAQKIANEVMSAEYDAQMAGTYDPNEGYIQHNGTRQVTDTGAPTLLAHLTNAFNLERLFSIDGNAENPVSDSSYKIDPKTGNVEASLEKDQSGDASVFNEIVKYFDASLSGGNMFAVFKVDHTGSVSESFSNSITESDLSQKLNGFSSQARQVSVSFAGGNLGDGAFANTIETILGGTKDVLMGALSGMTLGLSDGIHAMLAGSYYDIPKVWQSSTANLPRASYTVRLITPYGHPYAQMQNIYIPLAMLLAGALPRSTGKASYGPPFLCQLWDRGRCQIPMGMIESISITRGTTNLAFTNKGQPNGIDVTFSVVDMSSIMHMPLGSGTFWDYVRATVSSGETLPTMDEDNVLMNYLATLAGLDMFNQIMPLAKARLQAARWALEGEKFSNPSFWANAVHDSATSGILSYTPAGWAIQALEFGQRHNAVGVTQ